MPKHLTFEEKRLKEEEKSRRHLLRLYPYKTNFFATTDVGQSFLVAWDDIGKLARSFSAFYNRGGKLFTMRILSRGVVEVTRRQ